MYLNAFEPRILIPYPGVNRIQLVVVKIVNLYLYLLLILDQSI